MKPTLLTALSFLLFAFTTNLSLTFSQDTEQVVDSNGNPIFPGGRFYIKPAIFGPAGGGVRLGETGNSTCPVTILQDYSEVENGLVVKFTIPETSTGIIFTGTSLEVSFEEKPDCAESSKWVVVVDDDFPRSWVGIGGVGDHPGKRVINGTFNIQRYDELGYKLVFCSGNTGCVDIGRYDDVNGRRLILAGEDDQPYHVVFVDAGDTGRSQV